MGRTACTEPQRLYSLAIPLLLLWAVWPVQSLSACTRVHFTFLPLPCAIHLPVRGYDSLRVSLVQPHSQGTLRFFRIRFATITQGVLELDAALSPTISLPLPSSSLMKQIIE